MRGPRLYLLLSTAAVVLATNVAWRHVPAPSGECTHASAAGAEWTTPAGTVQGTRFSSLAQINTRNVNRLQEEFKFSTDIEAGHEGQPLVVNGVMYVVTP